MGKQVTRLTLFKIPDSAGQQQLLEKYRAMPEKATKDGKSYIVSLTAGPTFGDHRNQGFTIGVVTVFASKEDFVVRRTGSVVVVDLKALAKGLHQGILMVFLGSIFD